MERPKLVKLIVASTALVVAAGTLLYHFTRPAPGTVLNAGQPAALGTGSPPKTSTRPGGYTRAPVERQGGGYLAPGGR